MVTVKISEDARRMFRILAAHHGTTIHEEAEDAAWRSILNAGLMSEYKKSERARKVKNGSRVKGGK